MKRYLIIVIVLLCCCEVSAEEVVQPGEDFEFPDLLQEEYSVEDIDVPDLLSEEPVSDEEDGEHGFFMIDADGKKIYYSGISDPLESMNRVFFDFNDTLYFWVLKPVKNVYSQLLPADIRLCIGNFFNNLGAPVRFVNNILQGEFDDAGIVAGRFVINTFVGVLGLGDPAMAAFDIEPRGADFGQTLAKWGIGEGAYVFWPLLGPSSIRDSFGMVGDLYLHPVGYFVSDYLELTAIYTVDQVNVLSLSPEVYEELKRMSLDPYIASREAYYEYRRQQIRKDE